MEWLNRPEQLDLEVVVNMDKFTLNAINHIVALFRKTPDMDYIAYLPPDVPDTDPAQLIFNRMELARQMAGIVLGEFSHDVPLLGNQRKTFYEVFGWNSKTIIEDYPVDWEVKAWSKAMSHDIRTSKDVPND